MAVKMSPKFVVLCSLAVGAIYTTGYSVSSSQGSSPLGAAQTTVPGATTSSQGAGGQGTSGNVNSSNSDTSQNSSQGNRAANTSTTNPSGTQSDNTASSSKSAAKSASQTNTGTSTKSAATTTAKSTTSTTKSSTTTTKTATSTSKTSSSTAKTATPPVQYRYLNGTYTGSGSNRIGTVEVAVSIHSGRITAVQITGCYTHYPQYYIDPVLPNYVVAHQTTQIPYVSGATLSSDDFHNAVVEALSKANNPNYKG